MGKKDKYGGEGELDASKRLRVLAHRVGYSVRPSRRRVARHPDDGGRLRLLRDVTAVFEPGEVTALMGPSGAGKTTLLDVISGRKTAGEITGRVLLGPECVPATKDVLKSVSAYVEQSDALLANLTVRETLLYQAELKCDPAEPAAVRETYVDRLLELLKLTPCRDVAVATRSPAASPAGNPNDANIGVALVTRPRVLFLDEPTSGLDSETSSDVVEVMRALAQSGVTVLATIHSPSSEAFRRFDALLMLREGRVSYCGPLFGPNGAVAYFDRLGAEPHDPNTNLADYLISVVATDDVDWVEAFAASDAKRRNSLKLAEWISSNPKHAKVEPGAILKRRLSLSLRDAGDHFGGIEIRPRGGAARAVRVLTRWRTRELRVAQVARAAIGGISRLQPRPEQRVRRPGQIRDARHGQSTQRRGPALHVQHPPRVRRVGKHALHRPRASPLLPRTGRRVLPRRRVRRAQSYRGGRDRPPRHARRTSHRVRGGGTPRVLSQVLARVLARATVGRRVGVRVRVARAEHGRREYPPPGVQHLSAALQRIADSTQGHRPRVGVVAAHAFRALRVASAADESFRKEPRTPRLCRFGDGGDRGRRGVLRRGRTRLGRERRIHPPVLVLLARDRGRRTLESQTRETVSTRR